MAKPAAGRETSPAATEIGLGLFLWLLAVLGAYFLYHKPLEASQGILLFRMALQVACALGVTAAAGGLGSRIAPLNDFPPLAGAAVQAALGFGLLALLILSVGAVLGVSAWAGWLLLLGTLVSFRSGVSRWLSAWKTLPAVIAESGRFGRLVGVALALAIGLSLFAALAPPLRWDSLNYHLVLPLAYLEGGRVAFLPENIFSGMPQGGEMLYTWSISLAGLETAVLLGLVFGVLAVVGTADYARARFGRAAGWAAGAALLGGMSLSGGLAWGYVDWLAALYGLGVFACLDEWGVGRGRRYLLLAGALAGFALGAKYTSGVAALAGCAWILLAGFGKSDQGEARPNTARLRNLVVFLLALALTSLPWWLKNWQTTGNPFFPFFIPTASMTPLRQELLQGQAVHGGWENALLLPWQASVTGIEEVQGFGASLGPLLLALGMLSWLAWSAVGERGKRTLRASWVFGVTALLVWAAAGRISGLLIQSRLYLVVFPIFGMLAGAGFRGLIGVPWSGVRLGRIAGVMVLLVLGLNLVETSAGTVYRRVPQQTFELESRDAFLVHNLGEYARAVQSLNALPPGSRVRMLWEARSLYCRAPCEADEVLDEWIVLARGHQYDAAAILGAWRSQGFTHVLVFSHGAERIRAGGRFQPQDWAAWDDVRAQLEPAADFGGVYHLYRIP